MNVHKRAQEFSRVFLRPDQVATLPVGATHVAEHLEFEIRLCTPTLDGSVNTCIARAQWERMLAALRIMRVRSTESKSVVTVNRYGRLNENITSVHTAQGEGTSDGEYRLKRKLGTLDLGVRGSPFDVRLAASLELPLGDASRPRDSEVTERLLKTRWSFVFFSMLRCDLTKLEPIQSHRSEPKFQVEIELLDAARSVHDDIDVCAMWDHVREIIAILARAADTHHTTLEYVFIKQKLQTRIA